MAAAEFGATLFVGQTGPLPDNRRHENRRQPVFRMPAYSVDGSSTSREANQRAVGRQRSEQVTNHTARTTAFHLENQLIRIWIAA
jgi:hypothetical protein